MAKGTAAHFAAFSSAVFWQCGSGKFQVEIEALRALAPLLSENPDVNHDDQPTATRSTTPSQPTMVPKAVNAYPQPEHVAEWKEKVKGWP